MTQKEKAKSYDEALERARKQESDYQKELDKVDKNTQLAGLLRAGISALEMVFPELRESEEERIIKTLQEYVKNRNWPLNGPMQDEVLAWLEKQKEGVVDKEGMYYYLGGEFVYCGYPATEENPYDFAMSQQEKQKEQAVKILDKIIAAREEEE